jgi:hypothetical protein
MVTINTTACPDCGGSLKPIGYVDRIVRCERGHIKWIKIKRLICCSCGKIHRELPEYLYPYKHYRADIIDGMIDDIITSYDTDYEDYPCETTVKNWKELHKKNIS